MVSLRSARQTGNQDDPVMLDDSGKAIGQNKGRLSDPKSSKANDVESETSKTVWTEQIIDPKTRRNSRKPQPKPAGGDKYAIPASDDEEPKVAQKRNTRVKAKQTGASNSNATEKATNVKSTKAATKAKQKTALQSLETTKKTRNRKAQSAKANDAAEHEDGDDSVQEEEEGGIENERSEADETDGRNKVDVPEEEEYDGDENEDSSQDSQKDAEPAPAATKRRRGRPPGSKKSKTQTGGGRKTSVANHGDLEEEPSDEEKELLNEDSLDKFSERFSFRVNKIKAELKSVRDILKPDIDSIQKHLGVMEKIVEEVADELDTQGTYNDAYQYHSTLRLRYQPLPLVLPRDPFPDPYSTDFDEEHPKVQSLFKSQEDQDTAIEAYRKHLEVLKQSSKTANELLDVANKFYLMAKGYTNRIMAQRKFIIGLIEHEETVKDKYIKRRIEERDLARRNDIRDGRKKAITIHRHIERDTTGRKRKQPSYDSTEEEEYPRKKRHETHGQGSAILRNRDAPEDISSNGNTIDEFETVPGAEMEPDPPTTPPPPIERVRIENFGDHTPGKVRRYENRANDSERSLSRHQNGILIDSEWTDDELKALDEGMQQYYKDPGRWLDIKEEYGGAGGRLANRTAEQLHVKANELKKAFTSNNIPLPSYWANVEEW